MRDSIFHLGFKAMPYWWEAWKPTAEGAEGAVPSRTAVAIVGAGYAGLSAAIELADPKLQTGTLEILRGLIERVVVHPVEKGFEIELVGEIAAMVDLGAQDRTTGPKGPAVPEAYRSSVKVVAGERNHRQFTLPPVPI